MSSTMKRKLMAGLAVLIVAAGIAVAVVRRGDAQGRTGDANLLARLVSAEAEG